MAVCGLICINLNNYTLKILDTHFSYNENLIKEKNKTNRYSTSYEKMENEKPYTRRENCYF